MTLILHPKLNAKAIAPTFGGNNNLHTFDVLHHAVMFLLLSQCYLFGLARLTPLSHNAQHSSGTMQPYSIMSDFTSGWV